MSSDLSFLVYSTLKYLLTAGYVEHFFPELQV